MPVSSQTWRWLPLFWFKLLRCVTIVAIALITRSALAMVSNPETNFGDLKKLSLEELTEVEVTSVSRRPEKLIDTASAIQVVSSEDIRRSGATTIPEALRLASNLNVARKNAHDWGISARGFNTELANKLLVLMDGRTLYTPLFSGVRWDVQNYLLHDLERIEVISGPGGTLWGSNAVNGVINITSKSARDTQGLYTEASTGSEVLGNYAVRYGGELARNIFYRVYGTSMDFGDSEFANGSSAKDGWSMRQGGFRIDAEPGTTRQITFQGDVYEGEEGFVGGGQSKVSGGNLLGRWTETLSSGTTSSLQVYYDRAELRQPVLASRFAPSGTVQDRMGTFDVDFQHRSPVERATQIVWGLGYRSTQDRFEAAPGLGFNPPNLQQELFSGFGQVLFALPLNAALTLGSKFEHTDYTGFEYSPTVRFQWAPNKGSLLWAAVSRAVRTPSRVDRDIAQPSRPPIILQGGSDFRSENVIAYEAGYRVQLSSSFQISTAAFYNRYSDIRSVRSTPATFFPLVFANDLEADTYGLELTSAWQPSDRWRLIAAYNLLRENVGLRPGGVDFNNGLNETADPEHQISLRSSIDLPYRIEIDTQLRWVDTLPINNSGKLSHVPSYFELDLRVGWRPAKGWEISVVGQNLLNQSHPEFGLPGARRVEFQRSVFVKAAWGY